MSAVSPRVAAMLKMFEPTTLPIAMSVEPFRTAPTETATSGALVPMLALGLPSGAVPARLYEVAPHFTQTGFGAMYAGGISMHKPRHDALAPEVRAALKVASDEYASAYSKEQFVRAVAAADTIRASKGTVVAMSDGERARLARAIENPTRAWIDSATRAGFPAREVLKAYMDGVRREGGRFARDWDRE